MSAIVEILQSLGVFAAGVLARFGLFLVMLAAVVVPALAIALVRVAIDRRRERRLGLRIVGGVQYRPGLRYAPGHTWLRPRRSGGALELGIDGIAERLLPAVSAVDLLRPGTMVSRGETVATLHGGGRELKIRAPIPGTVVGVNSAVVSDPGIVKRDGYERGWLVAIVPADASWTDLPRDEAAEGWIQRESSRWNRFLEQQLQIGAADGGELVAPAPWLIGEAGWRALAGAFLTV
jgi:glycine cleavage system H lipoate-binding protein